MQALDRFSHIYLCDFEFAHHKGEHGSPLCMVATEYRTGHTIRLWQDELLSLTEPPFPIGQDALFIAYAASAEMHCFLSLGWRIPEHILDLYAEFRCLHNEKYEVVGSSLINALEFYGIPSVDTAYKQAMQELAGSGKSLSTEEASRMLDYCESDVIALQQLLPAMYSSIESNLRLALLRGKYMAAIAQMEYEGIPIDTALLRSLIEHKHVIINALLEKEDIYKLYENGKFKTENFARFLIQYDIPWPQTPTGRLSLADEVFKDMGKFYPQVESIRVLRNSLTHLRDIKLAVGEDGRNRCSLAPFRTKTGRNAPSTNQYVFGLPSALRGLIKPKEGYGLAYIDWSQQEFGIAAFLSGDATMIEAYNSGDPYLEFAKQVGAVPVDATKYSHPNEREVFKACILAVQYGMGAVSLSQSIQRPVCYARELLDIHKSTYATFWEWSDAAVNHAMLNNTLYSAFGWKINVSGKTGGRTLANFPMQANGAEMLRIACILGQERGVRICAPVHDAVLIEAPLDQLDHDIAVMQQAMEDASAIVLGGDNRLRSSVDSIIRYPDRYSDKRGKAIWNTVMQTLEKITLPVHG